MGSVMGCDAGLGAGALVRRRDGASKPEKTGAATAAPALEPSGSELRKESELRPARLLAGGLLRVADPVAVGPDQVAVVVGRIEAGHRVVGRAGIRLAVAAVAEQAHDADAAQRIGVVQVVRVVVLPAVQDRNGLDVLRHQDGAQGGGADGLEVGQVDVAGGGGAGGGGARL